MQTELDKLNREVGIDPKYLVDSTCNHKSNEKCGQQKADSWDHESKKINQKILNFRHKPMILNEILIRAFN